MFCADVIEKLNSTVFTEYFISIISKWTDGLSLLWCMHAEHCGHAHSLYIQYSTIPRKHVAV